MKCVPRLPLPSPGIWVPVLAVLNIRMLPIGSLSIDSLNILSIVSLPIDPFNRFTTTTLRAKALSDAGS